MEKKNVLFLCTGNSCRSQLAEALARKFAGDVIEPYSAGIFPIGVNKNVIKVLSELGIDAGGQKSKDVRELMDIDFDLVVTVCDNANENCPIFPKKVKVIHRNFEDPSRNKITFPGRKPDLSEYRRIRDMIKDFVIELPKLF